jgi:hypothetical protein
LVVIDSAMAKLKKEKLETSNCMKAVESFIRR